MNRFYFLVALLLLVSTQISAQVVPAIQWSNMITSTGNDVVTCSAVDASGNVYVGGGFSNTVDFDPGAGVTSRTASGTTADAFIVSYTSAGAFRWVVTFGSATNDDYVNAIATDGTSVYATGYFIGTVDFDPSAATQSRTAVGGFDGFLAKYSAAAGAYLFANIFGGASDDFGSALTLDASGNVYLGASFQGTVDFDPSATVKNLVSWGSYDGALVKYTSAGVWTWADDLGSIGDDGIRAISAIGTDLWICGYYSGFFYGDPNNTTVGLVNSGATDGFVGKYFQSNGGLSWIGYVSSTLSDNMNDIWTDGTSVYVAGSFSGTATVYGETSTSKVISNNGLSDAFVARYTVSDNKLQWVNTFGSTIEDFGLRVTGDGTGVWATGSFQNSMDVDPTSGVKTLTSVGGYDLYAVKYNTAGVLNNAFSIGSTGLDEGEAITLNSGVLYLAGAFTGTVDVDPSTAVLSMAGTGGFDSFTAKYISGEPTASATGLGFTNILTTSMTLGFTAASGIPDGYVGIYRIGSAPTGTPVDGTAYNVGDAIGNGNVLFVGSSTSYNLVSLAPGTQYFFSIFPYNGISAGTNYRTTSPLAGSATTTGSVTEPSASPTSFVTSAITTTGGTVTFTAAVGAPAGYIAVRATGTAPTTDPVDGTTYTSGTTLGNGVVAYVGSAVTFSEIALTAGTSYSYKIYSYNGSGTSINYRQTSPLTGTLTTSSSSLATEPSASPSALVFSNVTSSSYGFTYLDAVGGATGYVGIRRTGAVPTFVPTDGVELVAGTTNAADGSVVNFFGPGTAWSVSSATASTTYYYAIYSYNGSGTNINYRQASPLTGSVTTLAPSVDQTGPVIVDNTAVTTSVSNVVVVTATITDAGSGVDHAYVDFYPINSTRSGYGDMVNTTGNTWTYSIPADYVTEQGVEYTITAYDVAGNSSSVGYKQVRVAYADKGLLIPYSAGSDVTKYRIISVPLDLTKKTVDDVFGDNLGSYDKSKYRLFRYQNGGLSELSGSSSIEIGKGYWFISTQNPNIDTGPGVTADVGEGKDRFSLSIVQGWNQIGNPFNFVLKWSDISGHSDNADLTLGDYISYNGSFAKQTNIEKFGGGFVMVQSVGDGKLVFPHVAFARRDTKPPVDFAQSLDSDIWAVDLTLKSGGQINDMGGFGMHPDALEANDRYDGFTVPRFMDYLELNFNKKFVGSNFNRDIVTTSANHMWEFEVASNLGDRVGQLVWDNSYFGAADRKLVLFDVAAQRAIDMKSETQYTFDMKTASTFRIYFGDEKFVKAETSPVRAVFHSVSPVPADGDVTFEFSLPETGGEQTTQLVVYDMTGRRIATVVDQPLAGGYQRAVWNIEGGTKPAAGVYISVLKFGNTTLQKRLMIR